MTATTAHVIECDRCGVQAVEPNGHLGGVAPARRRLARAGWSIEGLPIRDYCPQCTEARKDPPPAPVEGVRIIIPPGLLPEFPDGYDEVHPPSVIEWPE